MKTAWQTRCYESGTHIVNSGAAGEPWLYVVIQNPLDMEDDSQRFQMCQDLAAFLNGGCRPPWLNDLTRTSDEQLRAADGAIVEATGPMFDADPPNCNWQQVELPWARLARKRLIDRLCEAA